MTVHHLQNPEPGQPAEQEHTVDTTVEPTSAGPASAESSQEAAPPAYRLAHVAKTYAKNGQTITPLVDVDLEIMRGEFVTVQGPTGGGKSTLLQLLGALDRPTGGSIAFDGQQLGELSDRELTRIRKERIGFVFQSFNLLPTLTAFENVDTALESRGIERAERDARVTRALDRVGLGDRGDHRPTELSGGQQQRVAIARAIVARPSVLLADEPTGNLDERMRDEILDLLQELNREGLTIIAVTHDSAVAKRADLRLRLDGGRIHVMSR